MVGRERANRDRVYARWATAGRVLPRSGRQTTLHFAERAADAGRVDVPQEWG